MSVCACRQQAEQQRQLVQYYNVAREVSGVRRRCAEHVAQVRHRAAEEQGFFYTAPHQICQARIPLYWMHPFSLSTESSPAGPLMIE